MVQTEDFPKLDKTAFSVVSLFDEPDEKYYWWSKAPQERLAHMEWLRWVNYGDKTSQRLQRFFEVVERKKVEYLR